VVFRELSRTFVGFGGRRVRFADCVGVSLSSFKDQQMLCQVGKDICHTELRPLPAQQVGGAHASKHNRKWCVFNEI